MYKYKPVLLVFLCFFYISVYSQEQYYVSTLAGDTANLYKGLDSNAGYHDGPAASALFNGPSGIAADQSGNNVYVADTYNNIIRKINVSAGLVTTIAGDTADIKKGLDSNLGYENGPASAAKFANPFGICVDDTGNVYVADTYNNVIRKIWASTGMVTTYAGKDSSGATFAGWVNGPDSVAEFFIPTSLAIDSLGNIYVADYGNNAIREISASGMVTTLVGDGPDTSGYTNGPVDTADFYGLFGIAFGNITPNAGAIFVSQPSAGYNAVRRFYHDTVTTYAGFDTVGFDTDVVQTYGAIPTGYNNGYQYIYRDSTEVNSSADTVTVLVQGVLYNGPAGLAFDTLGNLLIADEFNNVIRFFNAGDSLVSTFAGNDTLGFRNGADSIAEFYNPVGIAPDKKGNFYVSDIGNNVIRIISTRNFSAVPTIISPAYALSVYPNPCTDRLAIVSSFNGEAELLDVYGRVVWSDVDFKSPYVLAISALPPGVYFLRITSPSVTGNREIEVVR